MKYPEEKVCITRASLDLENSVFLPEQPLFPIISAFFSLVGRYGDLFNKDGVSSSDSLYQLGSDITDFNGSYA